MRVRLVLFSRLVVAVRERCVAASPICSNSPMRTVLTALLLMPLAHVAGDCLFCEYPAPQSPKAPPFSGDVGSRVLTGQTCFDRLVGSSAKDLPALSLHQLEGAPPASCRGGRRPRSGRPAEFIMRTGTPTHGALLEAPDTTLGGSIACVVAGRGVRGMAAMYTQSCSSWRARRSFANFDGRHSDGEKRRRHDRA